MAKETEKEALITLDFSGIKKKFADIDELREFMQSQKDAWAWLEQAAQQDGNLDRVRDLFKEYFTQSDKFIKLYETSSVTREVQTNLINAFRSQTQTAVIQGFILAETPDARFVLTLKENKSSQVAAYTLASLTNTQINASNPAAHEGAFLANKYREQYQLNSVGADHRIFAEKNKQLSKEITMLQERTLALTKEVDEHKIKQASDFKGHADKQASDFKITLDETKKKLADFEATFKEKIALQSPVIYWDNKRINHQKAMYFTGIVTICIAAFALVFFILAAVNFHGFKEIFGVTMGRSQVGTESELLGIIKQISILLAISTISFWLTRLTTKIFISNLHLKMDAEERATMFRAYLSLLFNDKALNDDNRQLILQSLFRPSTTGIIKDDGPISIPETMVKSASQTLKK